MQPTTNAALWNLYTRLCQRIGTEEYPRLRAIYVHGRPGIGKTYGAYHVGRTQGLYAVTCSEEMPSAELRGHYVPKGGEFQWYDGPVIRACREGARLVVNEVTHASEDALTFLYPILDDPSTARLTLPTGETVTPEPGFHVIGTDNCAPHELPEPLRNRFQAKLALTGPCPEGYGNLPEQWRIAAQSRHDVSLREWNALATLYETLGDIQEAALLAFEKAETAKAIAAAIKVAEAKVQA